MSPQKMDIIFRVFFFVLGVFILFAIPYQIKEPGFTRIGPKFFPRIVSLMLMITSIALVLETFLKSKRNINNKYLEEEKFKLSLKEEVRVILLFF